MQRISEAPMPAVLQRLGLSGVTRTRIAVAALTLLAAGLAFLRLDYRAVYLDEAVSMAHARESWGSLLTTADPNMLLYYALLKLWTGAAGNNLLAVRSFSVIVAALLVPVLYALGRRLFGIPAGLLACLLLVTNAWFLRYAQEVRSYSLVALLAALSTYFFLSELERPSTSGRIGYVAASTLAFYAHFFAFWIVLVHVAALLAVRGRNAVSRRWLSAYAAICALTAPIAYRALTIENDHIGWLAKPGRLAVPAVLADLAGGSYALLAAVVVAVALAVPTALASRRSRFAFGFTLAWTLGPLLAAFAVSQAKPILQAKYLIVSLPGIVLLTAGALVALRRPLALMAVVCALAAFSAVELQAWYGFRGVEDWRSLTAYVLTHARRGDRLVFNAAYARETFERYSHGSPRGVAGSLAPARRIRPAVSGERIWLLLAHSQPVTERLRAAVLRDHRRQNAERFDGDIAAELYSKPTP